MSIVNYNADSGRCYWEALRRQPQFLLRAEFTRNFLGTLMGRTAYGRLKRGLKGSGQPVTASQSS